MTRLQQLIEQIEQQSNPPVHLWKPERVDKIDINIDVNGNWFHEGEAIARDKLVGLFASILWYENGQHYLVTPAEQLAIEVADVPYIIHQAERLDDAWVVITNTHEQIIIDAAHPVELRLFQEQWVPYVNIRYDLWARVNRSIYVQWATEALDFESNGDIEASEYSGTRAQALQTDSVAITLSSRDYVFPVAR